MDLTDVLAPLPPSNLVKRLVTFCVTDLRLSPHQVALTLRRAAEVARAVETLSAEANREAATARADAAWDAQMAAMVALARQLGIQ